MSNHSTNDDGTLRCGEFCPLACECGARASERQHWTAAFLLSMKLAEHAPEFVCERCAEEFGDDDAQAEAMASYVKSGRTLQASFDRAVERRERSLSTEPQSDHHSNAGEHGPVMIHSENTTAH